MKDLGAAKQIFGMRITRDGKNHNFIGNNTERGGGESILSN